MNKSDKNNYNYTVILERESEGGYHVYCPALKGSHSQGDTFEEALENITEAISLYTGGKGTIAGRSPSGQA